MLIAFVILNNILKNKLKITRCLAISLVVIGAFLPTSPLLV